MRECSTDQYEKNKLLSACNMFHDEYKHRLEASWQYAFASGFSEAPSEKLTDAKGFACVEKFDLRCHLNKLYFGLGYQYDRMYLDYSDTNQYNPDMAFWGTRVSFGIEF